MWNEMHNFGVSFNLIPSCFSCIFILVWWGSSTSPWCMSNIMCACIWHTVTNQKMNVRKIRKTKILWKSINLQQFCVCNLFGCKFFKPSDKLCSTWFLSFDGGSCFVLLMHGMGDALSLPRTSRIKKIVSSYANSSEKSNASKNIILRR